MPTESSAPTLLYVEDELLIQEAVAVALQEAGFELLVADNGTAALAHLEDDRNIVSGLITDINLGDGPTGWDVARTARQAIVGLPVVYVSAASDHEWTSEGVPGSVMITKPFVVTQIVVAISTLLIASCPPS